MNTLYFFFKPASGHYLDFEGRAVSHIDSFCHENLSNSLLWPYHEVHPLKLGVGEGVGAGRTIEASASGFADREFRVRKKFSAVQLEQIGQVLGNFINSLGYFG